MPTDTTGNQRGQHGFSDLREDQKQERQITAGTLSLSPSFSFSSVNKGHMRITDLIDFSPFKISYKKEVHRGTYHTQNLSLSYLGISEGTE